MFKFSKSILVALLVAASGVSSFAQTTQSTSPVNYDSYGWNNDLLSSITFASGTNAITSIVGSTSIADQGWGGEYEPGNQLYLTLVVDGYSLWGDHFAGGTHEWRSVSYDVSNDPSQFAALNVAVGGIDWSTAQDVELQLRSSTIGYPGWALHAQDAQFSATSIVAVPEPETYALMVAGLGVLGFVARRRKSA